MFTGESYREAANFAKGDAVQIILATQNNNLRVESRRVPKRSRALRNFLGTPDDVPAELGSWYSRFDARCEFLRRKFAHLLEPR
jgi:hypothetical protein